MNTFVSRETKREREGERERERERGRGREIKANEYPKLVRAGGILVVDV
jgi:hypothetical protein